MRAHNVSNLVFAMMSAAMSAPTITERANRARLTTHQIALDGGGGGGDGPTPTDIAIMMAEGPGVPLNMVKVSTPGDGTPNHRDLTMPPSEVLPVEKDSKYGVNGIFMVRAVNNTTVIGNRAINDLVVIYDGTSWSTYKTGEALITDKHGTFASYFTSDADFPDIESNAGHLSALYTVQVGQTAVIEFHGTIAYLGPNT